MLDQQQALAVLAAMDAADIEELLALLPLDGREHFSHPADGSLIIVAHCGTYGIAYSEFGGLALHEHPDVDTAQRCFDMKVDALRDIERQAAMLPTYDQIRSLPETPDVRYI